jgi:hypothetical protein
MYIDKHLKIWPCSPQYSSAILHRIADGTINKTGAQILLDHISSEYIEFHIDSTVGGESRIVSLPMERAGDIMEKLLELEQLPTDNV